MNQMNDYTVDNHAVALHHCGLKKRAHHDRLLVVAAVATLLFPTLHRAQSTWLESKSTHYSVFYQKGFERDLDFTRYWMDAAEQLMKSKYGVTPEHYFLSVYLLPEPAEGIDVVRSGENRCCKESSAGVFTGTIKLLTKSASVWKSSNLKSSLGLPKEGEDFHSKVLMSEYIPIGHYAAQDARPPGGWEYYSAPEWFVQGLQEYDAIFHTTDHNRTVTSRQLLEWAKRNRSTLRLLLTGFLDRRSI